MVEGYATDNEQLKHIASVLRSARRSKKLKFPTIVEAIRIREDHLKAMENGAFDQLPGGVYTRSHLKSYAEFLGLDSAPLLEQLEKELGTAPIMDTAAPMMTAEPYRATFSPNTSIVIGSLAVCVLVYGVWQLQNVPAPAPENNHQKQVETLYTAATPVITVVAKSEAQVKIRGPKGNVLWEGLMHEGDTYFAPDDAEVVMEASPLEAISLYVEGEEVMSTANLELRGGGLVLNREKLLANVVVK